MERGEAGPNAYKNRKLGTSSRAANLPEPTALEPRGYAWAGMGASGQFQNAVPKGLQDTDTSTSSDQPTHASYT